MPTKALQVVHSRTWSILIETYSWEVVDNLAEEFEQFPGSPSWN